MTQVAERTRGDVRWPVLLATFVVVLGLALVVQPVLGDSALLLLAGLPLAPAVLLWVPATRLLTSALAGLVAAALLYVVLWIAAAPTGFPSPYFGSPTAELNEVYGDPGSARLEVGVGTCGQDPVVTAEEQGRGGSSEIRLSSNEKVPRGGSDDCQDVSIVTLREPWNNRRVVDAATGEELEVRTDGD